MSELIDLMSNLQIKETKLNKLYYTKELGKVSKDINLILKKKKNKNKRKNHKKNNIYRNFKSISLGI